MAHHLRHDVVGDTRFGERPTTVPAARAAPPGVAPVSAQHLRPATTRPALPVPDTGRHVASMLTGPYPKPVWLLTSNVKCMVEVWNARRSCSTNGQARRAAPQASHHGGVAGWTLRFGPPVVLRPTCRRELLTNLECLLASPNPSAEPHSPIDRCTRRNERDEVDPSILGPGHPGTTAPRHPGTTAPRHPGTPARRHPGTPAPRHDGTTARRHDGTTARRHDGTTARRHDGTTGPLQRIDPHFPTDRST